MNTDPTSRRKYLGFTQDWRRKLRKDATPSERDLWSKLRKQRFFGYKWRRQASILKFVVDFYCASAKLAIELDGGVHLIPKVHAHDIEKTRYLEEHGIKVLRFTNEQLYNDWEGVSDIILDALIERDPDTFAKGMED